MTSHTKARVGIVAAGTALAAALTLGFAAPAMAAGSDADVIAANSGDIRINFPVEAAGATIAVYSQIPGTDQRNAVTADVDETGSVTLTNFAGPVWISLIQGSAAGGQEIPMGYGYEADDTTPAVGDEPVAAINRGTQLSFVWDEATNTFQGVAGSDPVIPTLDELQLMTEVTNYDFEPTQYQEGTAFTVSFSSMTSLFDGLPVNTTASAYMYAGQDGTQIAAGINVVDGVFQLPIGAERTTAPHTLVIFDQWGRVIAALTLDGGVAAEGDTASTVTGPQLAETGADADQAGLVAGLGAGLLALGAAAFVIARARKRVDGTTAE